MFPVYMDAEKIACGFAATLVQFLEALPEPLIPPSLHQRCSEVTSKDEAFGVRWASEFVFVN